jgi:hypothetical protein
MTEQNIIQIILPLIAFVNLILILIFFSKALKIFQKSFKDVGKKYFFILLVILLMALYIRSFATPHHHIFLIDESFYIEAAKNISTYFKSFLSTDYYPKQVGWPVLLSIPFFFFGANNYIAIYTSTIFSSLSIVLMFLLVYLLSKNKKLAVYSAFILSIFPLSIFYSGTAETISASVFFILATLVSFSMFVKNQKTHLLILATLTFLFSIQIRLENIFLLAPISAFIYLQNIRVPKKKILLAVLISLPFLISSYFQYSNLIKYYDNIYYQDREFFGIEGIIGKFADWDISLLIISFILLLLIGSVYTLLSNKKLFIFSFSWFFVYFLFYMIYLFSDDFHLLPGLVALIPITAYGIMYISKFVSKNKVLMLDIGIPVILILIFFQSYDVGNPEYVLETKIINDLKNIPENCTIITEIPNIITSTTELRAIDTIYFLNYADENILGLKNQCVLYFEDIYCYKDNPLKNSKSRCNAMHNRFNLTSFKSYREGKQVFLIHRIS